jgi:hypothetical protein
MNAKSQKNREPFLAALAGAAALTALYGLVIRPWMLTWGTRRDEIYHLLPGDELLPEPQIHATHAVTIQAPPSIVWPWLVQLGQGRGGFYSYDWIENMMGLEIQNAERILPEYQDLKVGDSIPLAPDKSFSVPVAILEPHQALVLYGDTRQANDGSRPPVKRGEYLAVSWGFYLFPTGEGDTRLIERWKANWTPRPGNTLFYRLFLEPGAFLMERKMLLGIKRRAESMMV